jgi:hypothetical protein
VGGRHSSHTITFTVRYTDFTDVRRSMTLKEAVDGNDKILNCLDQLFCKTITRRKRVRQVWIRLSGIQYPVNQRDLFNPRSPVRDKLDQEVDAIPRRLGFDVVRLTE